MVRAAGALRTEDVLATASAPWAANDLHAELSVTPAQTIAIEEAEQHANVLAVRLAKLPTFELAALCELHTVCEPTVLRLLHLLLRRSVLTACSVLSHQAHSAVLPFAACCSRSHRMAPERDGEVCHCIRC